MERVYFDNGATSYPKPEGVVQAVTNYMTNIGCNIGRGVYSQAQIAEDAVYETREMISELFNFDLPENVCFTKNITESLNVIIKGFVQKKDRVIVSTVEHNAVMRPLNMVGADIMKVDLISDCIKGLIELEVFLKKGTKAVIMTHSSNVTGDILPLFQVGKLCKKYEVAFIVDSAQSAGFLQIDMKALNIDCLCFTGHKSLLGPQGMGGFVISHNLEKKISSFIQGGTGSTSDLEIQPDFMPDKFESGTQNIPGIFGFKAALEFLKEKGIDSIREHERELCDYFVEKLLQIDSEQKQFRLVGKGESKERTPIVSLDFIKLDNAEVSHILQSKFNIQNRCGLHCSPSAHKFYGTFPQGTVRFGLGHRNTKTEVDYVCECIKNIVG
ncbi:MAG: aminotransferase class V-fold PLP-dependent enzyme [Proteocatella sp.]